MASSTQPSKLPNGLPKPAIFITTHDQTSGKAIVHSTRSSDFKGYDEARYTMATAYTTSTFPPALSNDADITAHDAHLATSTTKLNAGSGRGTVCRHVDFSPSYTCMMHRTQSLDYGIVVEGEIEMVLDSGEVEKLKRGDVAVQRATMHAWRNPSNTEWARMVFVLIDCEKVKVGEENLGDAYVLQAPSES